MKSTRVASNQLKAGDVILNKRGTFVLMTDAGWNKRGRTTYMGVFKKQLTEMLEDPKDTHRMKFFTISRPEPVVDKIGVVPAKTVKQMNEMYRELNHVLYEKKRKNMEALDLEWNDKVVAKHGHKYFKGAYDVTTMKDEKVSAGDLVMVQFSNGKFEMVMGNENGHTYDPTTGRFLCRSPWKVEATPKVRTVYDPRFGVVTKISKPKARTMPPETLLYLIKKKEDTNA